MKISEKMGRNSGKKVLYFSKIEKTTIEFELKHTNSDQLFLGYSFSDESIEVNLGIRSDNSV